MLRRQAEARDPFPALCLLQLRQPPALVSARLARFGCSQAGDFQATVPVAGGGEHVDRCGRLLPLSRAALALRKLGVRADTLPLSFYADHDWATLRADALDRFGTAVEHRFSRREVEAMMAAAGLRDVRFAEGPPYWTALGYKA